MSGQGIYNAMRGQGYLTRSNHRLISKEKTFEENFSVLKKEISQKLIEIEKRYKGIKIHGPYIKSDSQRYEISVRSYINDSSFQQASGELAEILAEAGEKFCLHVSASDNEKADFGASFFKHYILRK